MAKSLLFVLLSLMILAAPAAAQIDPTNLVTCLGWPMSTVYDHDCLYQETDQTITVYLYLHDPVNPDFDGVGERAVTNVGGFYCRVTATEGLNILGWDFPVEATVSGQNGDLQVNYSQPVPVGSGSNVLATATVYVGGVSSFDLAEGPVPRCVNHDNAWIHVDPPAMSPIPGQLAYWDADDTGNPLVEAKNRAGFDGSSYDHAFQLHLPPVPSDSPSWGTLKALYR